MPIDGAPPAEATSGVQNTHKVVGMTCGGCCNTVSRHIAEVAGVTDVGVDVAGDTVTVARANTPSTLRPHADAVERARYQFVG